jgi:hypothetical protein
MTGDEDSGNCGDHEDGSGDKRARRSAPDAADTVATGAACSHSSTEPDHQSRNGQQRQGHIKLDGRQVATEGDVNRRRDEQTGEEGHSPANLTAGWAKQSAKDAADAGDAPVQHQKESGGCSDQDTASKGGNWSEVFHDKSRSGGPACLRVLAEQGVESGKELLDAWIGDAVPDRLALTPEGDDALIAQFGKML